MNRKEIQKEITTLRNNFKNTFLGKRAGFVRNEQMAKYSDMLLLIWDGESRGSKSMKELMIKEDKLIVEIILK